MADYQISIVVPTFNGEKKIRHLLESLVKQTIQNFELIIVVDGSTDNTLRILDEFKTRFHSFHILNQTNQGRAHTRNAGANKASADLLLFIDDDIELDTRNVENHFKFHESRKNALLFGDVRMCINHPENKDFSFFRYQSEASWRENFPDDEVKIDWFNYGFTSQNLSMTRQLFFELGGFDNSLTDSEDFDLGVRALIQRKDIFFSRNLKSIHHDAISIERYISRQQQYYASKKSLLEKNPTYQTLLPRHFAWQKPKLIDYPKKWIMSKKSIWIDLFQSIPFLALPQRLRFYLYSTFIYTHSVLQFKK